MDNSPVNQFPGPSPDNFGIAMPQPMRNRSQTVGMQGYIPNFSGMNNSNPYMNQSNFGNGFMGPLSHNPQSTPPNIPFPQSTPPNIPFQPNDFQRRSKSFYLYFRYF